MFGFRIRKNFPFKESGYLGRYKGNLILRPSFLRIVYVFDLTVKVVNISNFRIKK